MNNKINIIFYFRISFIIIFLYFSLFLLLCVHTYIKNKIKMRMYVHFLVLNWRRIKYLHIVL